MKRTITTLTIFLMAYSLLATNLDSVIKYKPQINGKIRAKYEYNSSNNGHRFQVRNARFGIHGKFSDITSYKAEIDLSDEGVTKMLDAYIRLQPRQWFDFTIGQQKIPFSTDNLRSPHLLYFANRSFIGKQMTSGLRDVGATIRFHPHSTIPLRLAMGVYNGDGIYNQKNWNKTLNFAVRGEMKPTDWLHFSVNYNAIQPENLRMHLFDVGFYIDLGNWHFDTEYFYKYYTKNVFEATQAFFAFTAYDFYTKKSHLTKITPLVRFDAMGNNNKGKLSSKGTYDIDDVVRSRLTGGVTFSLNKPFTNDIRINYEQYFYKKGVANNDNKLVVEYVVRF